MRKVKIVETLIVLLPLICAESAGAQATPESAVNEFLQIAVSQGLEATIDTYHPDALLSMKKMFLPIFLDVESEAARLFLGDVFGPGVDAEDVSMMPAKQFARRVFSYSSAGIATDGQADVNVLGVVEEGALRHVVVRLGPAGVAGNGLGIMEVFSVKMHENKWKMMLGADLNDIEDLLQDDAEIYTQIVR